MDECPCGLSSSYTDCCAPLIRGAIFADTAEDLLRSRYTAYYLKNWDYLALTTHPAERGDALKKGFAGRGEGVQWKRLEVLGCKNGGRADSEGEVTFVAYYAENGVEKSLSESSAFLKEDGRWYYSEKRSKKRSVQPAAQSPKPFVRSQTKVGRNDPCSCGSGKKFKKCCGK